MWYPPHTKWRPDENPQFLLPSSFFLLSAPFASAQTSDSADDTGGAPDLAEASLPVDVADPARTSSDYTFDATGDAPTMESAYEADQAGGLLLGECSTEPDPLLMTESLLFSESQVATSESQPGFLRGMCVPLGLADFTLPVLTPRNRDTELPVTMDLNLFGDTFMTGQRRYWERNVDGSVSWIGVLRGPLVPTNGEVLITVRNGVWAMTARLGTKMWDLRRDVECGYRLQEWDEALLVPGPDAVEVTSPDSPETAYVQQQDVVFGVLPLHPSDHTPTLDILMVGTQDGLDDFGSDVDGYVAFGHNRVHETELIFLRTARHRSHRPRMVGYYFEPSVISGVGADVPVLQASAGLDAMREDTGADVVISIGPTAGGNRYAGIDDRMDWRPGLSDNPNMPAGANWDDEGYLCTPSDPASVADWFYSRAIGLIIGGHTEDIPYHRSQVPPYPVDTDQNGTSGMSFTARWQGRFQNQFTVGDLLSNTIPRTPVFGGYPWDYNNPTMEPELIGWGYAPEGTDPSAYVNPPDPANDRLDLDIFGPRRYDRNPARAWATFMNNFSGFQGIPLGNFASEPLRQPVGGDFLRCLGTVAFDQPRADSDPWSEPDTRAVATDGATLALQCQIEPGEHGAVEAVAYYKEATIASFDWQLASVLSAQVVNGELVMTFDQTDYAATLLPPVPVCTDLTETTCSLDSNPYFIELGTAYGVGMGSELATWVGAAACANGVCTVSGPSTNLAGIDEIYPPPAGAVPAALSPNTLYFGRLWSQISANHWSYVEFRVNHELPSVVSCASEDPSYVPTQHTMTTCAPGVASVIASSAVFPGVPALQISLDPTGLGTNGADASLLQSAPIVGTSPYDGVVVGTTAAGVDFCCLLAEPSANPHGVEVIGGKYTDNIQLGEQGVGVPMASAHIAHIAATGGWGGDIITAHCAEEGSIYLSGGINNDSIWTRGQCFGTVNGDAHTDRLIAEDIQIPSGNPSHVLAVNGSGSQDTLQATAYDLSAAAPAVTLHGGGGIGNVLCTDHGGVSLTGSSPGAGASTLYISDAATAAVPYLIHPSTIAGTAGSQCGAPVHQSNFPGWAGAQCLYPSSMTRPPACHLVAD
jgi:hypothetical protein